MNQPGNTTPDSKSDAPFAPQPMVSVFEGQVWCSWCGTRIGDHGVAKAADLNPQTLVSHGICRTCKEKQLALLGH